MRETRRMRSCGVSGGGRGSEESGRWEGGEWGGGEIGRDENCGAAPLFLSTAASSSHHVVRHAPLVWTHH